MKMKGPVPGEFAFRYPFALLNILDWDEMLSALPCKQCGKTTTEALAEKKTRRRAPKVKTARPMRLRGKDRALPFAA